MCNWYIALRYNNTTPLPFSPHKVFDEGDEMNQSALANMEEKFNK